MGRGAHATELAIEPVISNPARSLVIKSDDPEVIEELFLPLINKIIDFESDQQMTCNPKVLEYSKYGNIVDQLQPSNLDGLKWQLPYQRVRGTVVRGNTIKRNNDFFFSIFITQRGAV